MTVYSQMENALNVAAGGRDVDGRQGVYVLFDLMHKVHCGKCALNKKKEEVLKCSTCSDLRTTVDGVIFRAGMASGKSARSGCRAKSQSTMSCTAVGSQNPVPLVVVYKKQSKEKVT